jgi:ectoine hydroxylase-related dioxygenase (phytanoyl-CoA dioxygenase family)
VDPDAELPPEFADMPDFQSMVDAGEYEVAEWPEMQAGDALVIHPYTIHGAPGNASQGKTRIAFTSRLMGDDVRWQPTPFAMKMAGVDYDKIEVGSEPEGPLFPVVWTADKGAA